ncbi:hypothetical protein MYCTH_2314935 [Thermothelomyces thermophilus ATCC 42464]|uniref:Uncharacterized protein n=1 Tax=Thermothelomyces thermophilus (strain ATCC 42464 / BCRC 31852 / DSM 1799) TaxID=573729 RepID=G2Q8P5_THET4|nr:uncharacterized protein MYCTH_2314935 [Thermothelomyces thermophilus ATCC 42464]AEO57094.1 hypothetical protein MYCTH_2314935 [Thermothelomyces thermophilus ATCC 42464]
MAFQQPTRQLPSRVIRNEVGTGDRSVPHPPQDQPAPNESQTWVLFTPGTDAGTTASYLSSVQDDQITAGRSRIGDLGSLDTSARSEFDLQAASEGVTESVAEEDAELDSLDSHLPEFRTVPGTYDQPEVVAHAAPVLPGHDGLGSFPFEAPAMSAEVQERMYAFERFNPNRVTHRADSFNLALLEPETEEAQDLERNRRIEAWRLEQSRLLLEDIRKETRRRRLSEASLGKAAQQNNAVQQEAEGRSVADEEAAEINLSGTDWHDQDEPSPSGGAKPGFWNRIARTVIRDLLGIDDRLLAILFGEALPEDVDMVSSTPTAPQADARNPAPSGVGSESHLESDWQLRMLERISRELGVLVHHMSTHPGAFSTYTRVQHVALPYAGLPVIPEAPADVADSGQKLDDSVPSMPQFKPTISRPVDALSARRPSEQLTHSATSASGATATEDQHTFTQQEWEQDLDIRLVFRYLRSRFSSSRQTSPSFSPGGTPHRTGSSTQDVAAKVARVRQHHPLVSHAHAHAHTHGYHRTRPAVERRTFKATVPSSPVAVRHAPGSCASQSTRRSARRSSISSRPSSRHYWDIGGSIGTGSVIASTGPMGSWGEV